jgi:hypothetical protein
MELLKKFIFALIIFLLVVKFIYSQGWYAVTITNNQSQATPAPFQQDIAICNGNPGLGPNFAYINNVTLFNEINPNGQNVYFVNSSGSILYSWYEGQANYNGVYCDVWWINLPNGIPANGYTTIYMYIGSTSDNYYSQYYPYVGASPQVISGYDNGQDVFIAYGYFNNTFDEWTGYIYQTTFSAMSSITATPNGIEMLNNNDFEGTYILPPNNWNIPKIPLIVEDAWYYTKGCDANAVSLFGNTNQQISAYSVGTGAGGITPASSSSTFVQFEYCFGYTYLKSAVTNSILNETFFPYTGGTFYTYLIVNSSYAQTGYYIYNSNQVWAPLTLLDTYNINSNGYTYANLSYNPYDPFQYGTLEISAGAGSVPSYQYVQWVVARAYPPNDVMPSISIQPVSVSSTQTTSTVTTSTSTVTQASTITTTVTTTLTSTSTITSTLTVYSTITTTTTVTSSVTATSTTTSTVYNTVTSTVTTTLTSTNTVISTVYTTLITTLTSTSTIYSTITSTQTVTSTVYTTATTSTVSPSIYSITQTLTGSSFTQTIPSTSYIYPINQISSITIINLNSSNISTSYTYSCSSNMT